MTVVTADADTDSYTDGEPAGSTVFFPGLIFFIHNGKGKLFALGKVTDFHFGQHIGFASGYAVNPLLAVLVCFDGKGIIVQAGQGQLMRHVPRNPDQYFADTILWDFFVGRINLHFFQQLFCRAVQQFRPVFFGEALEDAAVILRNQVITGSI